MNLIPIVFLLGLRHGIDWDHMAAITDIVGTTESRRRGFLDATLYIAGHASVVILIGLLVILLGVYIPPSLDDFMGKVVGVTLILLGIYLVLSLFIQRKNFKPKSRWMVIAEIIQNIQLFIHNRIPHHHHTKITPSREIDRKAAFTIGMIHGIGAETPTQMLVFISAAGAQKTIVGPFILLTFVTGLVISNSFITALAVLGYRSVNENSRIRIILGIITAVVSLYVGTLFFLGRSSFLPAVFG